MGGLSFGRDITDRKRIEHVNAGFAAIVAASDAAIIGSDLGGGSRAGTAAPSRSSATARTRRSGSRSRSSGRTPGDVDEALARARAGESVQFDDTVRRRRDGTLVEVSVTVSPVTDRRGNVIGSARSRVTSRERKRAERQRELALEDLQEAQRLARIGSWRRDLATSEVTWSEQLYAIFDRDPADGPAFGETLLPYVHPDDRERVVARPTPTRRSAPPHLRSSTGSAPEHGRRADRARPRTVPIRIARARTSAPPGRHRAKRRAEEERASYCRRAPAPRPRTAPRASSSRG